MTKQEAIDELKDIYNYWHYTKMYNNEREQEAVLFAIDYLQNN